MAKSGETLKILISNNAPTLAAITYLRTVIKIKKYSNYKSQEENLLKLAPPHSTDWCGTSGYETALKFILTLQNEGFDSDYHLPLESKTETYASRDMKNKDEGGPSPKGPKSPRKVEKKTTQGFFDRMSKTQTVSSAQRQKFTP